MVSERPVDPRPQGLPDDRAELWYVCTGTINSHEPSDEVKLMVLGIKRQLELEARAYHAERLVGQLRARVAELEGIVGAAEKMYEAADCYCENWEPDCDLGTALAVAMKNYMISTATKGVAGE